MDTAATVKVAPAADDTPNPRFLPAFLTASQGFRFQGENFPQKNLSELHKRVLNRGKPVFRMGNVVLRQEEAITLHKTRSRRPPRVPRAFSAMFRITGAAPPSAR